MHDMEQYCSMFFSEKCTKFFQKNVHFVYYFVFILYIIQNKKQKREKNVLSVYRYRGMM